MVELKTSFKVMHKSLPTQQTAGTISLICAKLINVQVACCQLLLCSLFLSFHPNTCMSLMLKWQAPVNYILSF